MKFRTFWRKSPYNLKDNRGKRPIGTASRRARRRAARTLWRQLGK